MTGVAAPAQEARFELSLSGVLKGVAIEVAYPDDRAARNGVEADVENIDRRKRTEGIGNCYEGPNEQHN